MVVSVEWGRRRLARGHPAWRLLIAAGNTLAGIVLLSVLGGSAFVRPVVVTPDVPQSGVWVDGGEVRNIFPYDEHGRPLSGVQLYDQNGRPVVSPQPILVGGSSPSSPVAPSPSTSVSPSAAATPVPIPIPTPTPTR